MGSNSSDQLGDDLGATAQPRRVGGLGPIAAIAAGPLASYAVDVDGSVWTWQIDRFGELSSPPEQVLGLPRTTAVAAGGAFGLALADDGTVWAWGPNVLGELGTGTYLGSNVPQQVSASDGRGPLDNVVAIAAGGQHSLALRADGSVWSWGFGASRTYGQSAFSECLEPRNKPCSLLPESVPDLRGATSISAAYGASLAIAPAP